MSEPIGVGVLGYGYAGRSFHAYLLSFEPRLRLHAVASRAPERRERAEHDYPGIRTYETLEQMLEDPGVQLVIVATPHHVHAEQCIQSMDAGRHVVTDKVMCLTTAEADAMIAARDRNHVLLSVFHNRRWDGDYMTVRQALADGLLGQPFLFEVGSWGYGKPRGWRSQPEEVGTLLHDWGAHFVDQALQLVPSPVVAVRAQTQHVWPDVPIESTITADLRFADDVIYRLEVCRSARLGKPHWYIVGDQGALIKEGVDPQEAAMVAGSIDSAREDPANYARVKTEVNGIVAEMRLQTLRGSWKSYYQNIADALDDPQKLAVKPEEVRRVVAVLEAVTESVRTGEVVRPAGGI
jgi:scyllo-inositol 2-dehydrogenase (NADP+)